MSSGNCICKSRAHESSGLELQSEMPSVYVRNVKPWRLLQSSKKSGEEEGKVQVGCRKTLMWAEKKGPKRRQKMSYRYAENQASARKECLRKEEVNSAVNIIHSSLREMQRDECLLDLATFCGVLWSEADSRAAE